MRTATDRPARLNVVHSDEPHSAPLPSRSRVQQIKLPPPLPPRTFESDYGRYLPSAQPHSSFFDRGDRRSVDTNPFGSHPGYLWGARQPQGLVHHLGNFVDAFSRFAQLLDMTSDGTLWGSLPSLRWLLEGLGRLRKEFLFICQTYTLFKILRLVTRRAGGLLQRLVANSVKGKGRSNSIDLITSTHREGLFLRDAVTITEKTSFQGSRRKGLWWILLLLSAIGGPLLVNRLWRVIRRRLFSKRKGWDREGIEALALYDFVGESRRDLSFCEGDVIWVTSRPRTTVPTWWKGSLNGQSGLLPSNYVQVL